MGLDRMAKETRGPYESNQSNVNQRNGTPERFNQVERVKIGTAARRPSHLMLQLTQDSLNFTS